MLKRCLTVVLLVAGCSSATTEKPPAPKPDAKVLMQHVLRQMAIPGQASAAAVRNGASELFALPESVPTLIAEYQAAKDANLRWGLLTLAGKTTRADAVTFLAAEAIKPIPPPTKTLASPVEHGDASSTLDDEFVNRLAAAIGIANSMAVSSNSDAQAAMAQVISQADLAIAKTVGAELFARQLLSSQLAQALSARGINPQFSIMSPARVAQLFSAVPNFLTPPKNGSLPPAR